MDWKWVRVTLKQNNSFGSGYYVNGGAAIRAARRGLAKCAWISSGQGAAADTTFSTGTFPVQSLWSNAFNSGAGGCVQSY